MSIAQVDDIQEVWQRVRSWPQPMRLSLASKILQSLDAEETRPKKSLADMVGLWADMPLVTDVDVEQIIEEERIRKYG